MAGAQSAWGIDVGVSSLKAIKLRRDGDRVTIEAFDVIEHDKFLTEPDVDRDAMIRATLQKFMAKHAVRREVVYIGVPGSTAFARFVKLPPVETKKIPEIVRFEAIQQIPFPLDQVNWDFHTFQHPDSPDVEVGIFAMKKELVAHVMSNFRAVDMHVQGVVLSPLAVYNAAAYDGMTQDKGTVVIDMGAEHTDLVIMDQGRLWLRTINIGGNHFTDALAKSFKQPFARAETLKKTAATSKYQKQIYQAMRPIFADLVAEIQRSIGHYNSTHRDSRLERIVGMGNPFKLPNLQKYLQQELKMEVERLETYRMANVEKAAAFSENILSMTTSYGLAIQALGLAAIKTNLLPMEIARVMMWKKKQPWFIGATALLAVGALTIGARWWMDRSDFASRENSPEYSDNMKRESEAAKMLAGWTQINDTFAVAQTQVDEQIKLISTRKVWPMLYTDIMASLPQSNQPSNATIVMTDMNSDYILRLSAASTTNYAGPGQAAGQQNQDAPPSATLPAATVDPRAAIYGYGAQNNTNMGVGADQPPVLDKPEIIGDSDHGFVVSIWGYTQTGLNSTVKEFQDKLMSVAPLNNDNRPYYFSKPYYKGKTIPVPATSTGITGMPQIVTTAGENPWTAQHGPFWEMFIRDLTNYAPAPVSQGMGMGMVPTSIVGDLPFSIDMYATRLTDPPAQDKTMYKSYTFMLRFKVHVKNDIR